MKNVAIVGREVSRKPTRKFPKSASTITDEAFQKEIQALVVEMKTMISADLVKQRGTIST